MYLSSLAISINKLAGNCKVTVSPFGSSLYNQPPLLPGQWRVQTAAIGLIHSPFICKGIRMHHKNIRDESGVWPDTIRLNQS